ncbi:hypothetical protein [Ramlibacter sp.]|uniref:hypothetical protein n=1 Tax=Ramlibacter sp. TaxID=1917967 RepID=UPI002FCB2C97
MKQTRTTTTLLMAGLLAAGGAYAGGASPTSDVPVKAGEASTVTHGQPNMLTTNEPLQHPAPVSSAGDAAVTSATGVPLDSASSPHTVVMGAPADARVVPHYSATVTSNVPTRAGEFSTWTNGVPNMKTYNPVVDDGRVLYSPEQVVQRVPHQAGEVSTMVGGRPNWNPDDPLLN